MKIQVLTNPKGEVIAAFRRTPDELVSVEVELGEKEELEELDVADTYLELPPSDFVKRLQADIQAKRRR